MTTLKKGLSESLTPLMKQYEQLKSSHPEEVVLFRLGDFYEIFCKDAELTAPILEVALTQRQGLPMCGIPFHALDRYLPKLLRKNLRVAIAEQMEDPEEAKGIVRREVVRVVTPGTIVEENLLQEKSNNFLVALSFAEKSRSVNGTESHASVGIAALDVSTGQFCVKEIQPGPSFSNLKDEIASLGPSEILIRKNTEIPAAVLASLNGVPVHKMDADAFLDEEIEKLLSLGTPTQAQAIDSARIALHYVKKMSPSLLKNVPEPKWAQDLETMTLDAETIGNLEILKNTHSGASEGTLLSFLDRTLTAMGGRMLKTWLVRPLVKVSRIRERNSAVGFFVQEQSLKDSCRETLKGLSDLERSSARIASGRGKPRDLLGLKISLSKIHALKKQLEEQTSSPLAAVPSLILDITSRLGDWAELLQFLDRSLSDDPPVRLEDGGAIREGFDSELDEKRKAAREGKCWLQDLENRAKESAKIPTLKIGYTSVFGYYYEVTKPHLAKVPAHWHRKQTLLSSERYVDEELKNLEQKILGAEEQSLRIERRILQEISEKVISFSGPIRESSSAVSELDCILSFSETAEIKHLIKPEVVEEDGIWIADGWHPSVKDSLPPGTFVPNDLRLDSMDNQIMILTGPNMSGKSTYLRQSALIVLMAQVGSFVPAKEAKIGVVDRIFTRIGSGDRLAKQESTFMVEMKETARILNEATPKSLIILDEVGRGTSTYDGISIAWAVVEHLSGSYKTLKPKVLFATHYFELTDLASSIKGVVNFNVQAREWQDSVIFLYKIAPGPADRSYGIHVANLAGLPEEVLSRAKKILSKLEFGHKNLLQSTHKVQGELFTFPQND